jgi:hypothetical protein
MASATHNTSEVDGRAGRSCHGVRDFAPDKFFLVSRSSSRNCQIKFVRHLIHLFLRNSTRVAPIPISMAEGT